MDLSTLLVLVIRNGGATPESCQVTLTSHMSMSRHMNTHCLIRPVSTPPGHLTGALNHRPAGKRFISVSTTFLMWNHGGFSVHPHHMTLQRQIETSHTSPLALHLGPLEEPRGMTPTVLSLVQFFKMNILTSQPSDILLQL